MMLASLPTSLLSSPSSILPSFLIKGANSSRPLTISWKLSSRSRNNHLHICRDSASLAVLSFSGERVGETFINLRTAPPETSRAVVHRGLVTQLRNKRQGTASTKTRGEVRGGGRKPYKQKGTGRARRGSNRAPPLRGGGVVFGPKPRDWSIKINKKEKRLAVSTALSSAMGDMICVEDFGDKIERPRTKDFVAAMERWGLGETKKVAFVMVNPSKNVLLSCRNISSVKMMVPRNLNLFDILDADKLVVTPEAVDYLNTFYGPNGLGFQTRHRGPKKLMNPFSVGSVKKVYKMLDVEELLKGVEV